MEYMQAMSTPKSKSEAPQAEMAPGAPRGQERQAVLAHDHQHHDHAAE